MNNLLDLVGTKKKIFFIVAIILICSFAGYFIIKYNHQNAKLQLPVQNQQDNNNATKPAGVDNKNHALLQTETTPDEKTQLPLKNSQKNWPVILSKSQASSLAVVVNKKYKLPSDYVPALSAINGGRLRQEAVENVSILLKDAQDAGSPMKIISSYRSYATQITVYQKWVNLYGKTEADRVSARPGHSEHQTGLALDLGAIDGACSLEVCFGDTRAGKWLANNASKYGFIIRYPQGKEAATGYSYEPWHIRFVGLELANNISNSGKTMDQYFGIEAGGY